MAATRMRGTSAVGLRGIRYHASPTDGGPWQPPPMQLRTLEQAKDGNSRRTTPPPHGKKSDKSGCRRPKSQRRRYIDRHRDVVFVRGATERPILEPLGIAWDGLVRSGPCALTRYFSLAASCRLTRASSSWTSCRLHPERRNARTCSRLFGNERKSRCGRTAASVSHAVPSVLPEKRGRASAGALARFAARLRSHRRDVAKSETHYGRMACHLGVGP